jgi:hypothetical protein
MDLGSIIGAATGALGGGAIGGVLRGGLEVIKYLDRKADREHEVKMFGLNLQADAQRAAQNLAVIHAQHDADADTKDLDALIAGVTVQGQRSGVGWADALNTLVRPVLTLYWGVFLFGAVMIARYVILTRNGVPAADAVLQLWGPAEYAILSSMFSFWFVDRALRKGGGAGAAH